MGDSKGVDKNVFQKFTDGMRSAPDTLFNFGDVSQDAPLAEKSDPSNLENFQKSFKDYLDAKPQTVADGMFKGFLSIGSGVISGITGVVTEPVKEIQKKGAIGIVTGIGKGFSGLITKPLAGAIDMGVKTTQGVINTPGTLSRAATKTFGLDSDAEPIPENPVFGVRHGISLKNAQKLNITHPTITLIKYIRQNGMSTQGIFRESGNVSTIKFVSDNYNFGKEPNLDELEMREISGIFKSYFRSLPEPLLSFDLYDQLLTVIRSATTPARDIILYRALVKSLPEEERSLLQTLLRLLSDISKNSEVNKMSTSNLAIVFGPSLMRPNSQNTTAELFDMPDVTKVIDFLITHQAELFV